MRSVNSVRTVNTRRSAKQFARGHRGGILTTSMPASANTASNESVNWPARSRTRNRNRATCSPRSMTRLRTCWVVQGPSGVRSHAQDMQVAVADLEHEQDVEPLQRHRTVHMEEVDGQHAGGLRAQELPPGGVGAPYRCRWDSVALEDPPDCRGADAVAEFE